ncbi:hypothetical protein LH435_15320 [Laribacter hongkongensis]|uniref:hypothetical protein n=1 Tax=Laribacter hongkongensis TaxID=168471 RepID=UPI001EFD6780|nr:hypothetical protein [Laribacter hongkongensis]MCG8996682.1 hypothetical protein [Laribacter hongkongensis]MCG9011898.1 hypothetical protein [Laribacter hongkongensis]MCG9048421.1 hypothetical protein [Laribacter hongkongensis]MCG9075342.1 hypothetical protein [Laribacter hongkongensis]
MKLSAIAAASLLAILLAGCGDQKRIDELEGQLKKAKEDIVSMSDMIQSTKFEDEFLKEIHESNSYKTFPGKPSIAGYDLARETLAGQHIITERVWGGNKVNEPLVEVIAPLYWLEDRWPDRMSKTGLMVDDGLWWCRDVAVATRLAMSTSLKREDVDRFNLAISRAASQCVIALSKPR